MSSDIKLTDESVVVEGSLGVNTTTVHRTVEVTGSEVHSGGTGAGFSFASRNKLDVQLHAVLLDNHKVAKDNVFFKSFALA